MKHFLNITAPITKDIIGNFTISDSEIIEVIDYQQASVPNPLNNVWLTLEGYERYMREGKIYYMHEYNLPEYIDNINYILYGYADALHPIIFVYMKNDKESPYHVCMQMKDTLHFIDITKRLQADYNYWCKWYAPVSPFDISHKKMLIQMNYKEYEIPTVAEPSYFYDLENEAHIALIQYVVNGIRMVMSPTQVTYQMLKTDYTYNRLYNKIYEERVEKLKNEITQELQDRLSESESELKTYNSQIVKLLEKENELEKTIP